ncbi:MAG TPA: hypothetical protein VHU84_10100, partial [Lacipirellulaceae bacterium]|nr:hypothetical protein [Lacipirellulaceae bacterium]
MSLFDRFASWSPASAQERLRRGNLPRRMRVTGRLTLANAQWLTELPRTLVASSIDVSNCARLRALPARVKCEELDASNTGIERLDIGLEVSRRIMATRCQRLKFVGPVSVQNLQLGACTQLEQLAEGLSVRMLDVSQCARITKLPASVAARLWALDVSGCIELVSLPEGMLRLQFLSVRGCRKLTSLPRNIQIESRIEVAESGLTGLPQSLRSTVVCWRGVSVPDHVAFNPETITVREILYERNVELRRVLLERFGMERFIAEVQAETIDNDEDAGGLRRLLRVRFGNGEDI